MEEMRQIGTVTSYFDDIHVATVELTEKISLGEEIWFGEGENRFSQTVEALQIDDDSVEEAEAGAVVGVHIHQPVETGTPVFKQ